MNILFETERLIVRKFKAEDTGRLYENHRDEAVRKWFPNECYADAEEARDAVRFYADCAENGRLPFVLAAELKGTGELIGDAGISEVEGRPGETEIGYCIAEKYRGQGYAAELLRALSDFVFARFGTKVIWGRVVCGNAASAKVLENSGYAFVRKELGAEDDPYGNGMLVYRLSGPKPDLERWDAYDRDFTLVQGVTLIRGEKIPEGLYHLVCDIIVRHADGSYLVMQRDKRKHLGGKWEATAGGSALQGEDPAACARRELYEETGIAAGNLTELGWVLHHGHQSFYAEYLCITDADKGSIRLQEGETSDYKWITADELRGLSRDALATRRILSFIEELS